MAELSKLGDLGRSGEGERGRTVALRARRVRAFMCVCVCVLPGWPFNDLQKLHLKHRFRPQNIYCSKELPRNQPFYAESQV